MIINSVVKGGGSSSVPAKAIDAVAQEAVVGDKVLLNPAANTMKPIQEIASGATGGAGVMDVINNCLYRGDYKYYVDGGGTVQRERINTSAAADFGGWTNYGVFQASHSTSYFSLIIQGTTYTQQDAASSTFYTGFLHSANGEYVFVSGYYDEIRDLLLYKNKIIHEFPTSEKVLAVKFMRDTKGDDYLVYGDSSPYYNYARRLTPNGVGEPIPLTYDTMPDYASTTKATCLGNKKNLLVYATNYEKTDYVYEAVLDMDAATISFTERADLAEQLHEVKLTFSTTNITPPFVSVGSNTEVLFHSHYTEGGMMCLSYDENAGTISFFKRWGDRVKEVSYDLPTDTYYYRTDDGYLYKAHTIPQPQVYSAVKPSTEMFSPDATLTGFVKENNNGDLEVLTAEDPNRVVEPVAESSSGLKTISNAPVGLDITGTLTLDKGVLSGFSSGNTASFYLEIPNDATSFELMMKVKRNSLTDGGRDRYVLISHDSYSTVAFTPFYVYVQDRNGNALAQYPSAPKPLWQWVKMTWDGTTAKSYYSTDGVNFREVGTYATTTCPFLTYTYYVGSYYTSYFFPGEIDLKECYIKVNDNYLWKPYDENNNAVYLNEGWYTADGEYKLAFDSAVVQVENAGSYVYPYMVTSLGDKQAHYILSAEDPTGYESFKKVDTPITMYPDLSSVSPVEPEAIEPEVKLNSGLLEVNALFGVYGVPSSFDNGVVSGFSPGRCYSLPGTANIPTSLSSMEFVFKFKYTSTSNSYVLGSYSTPYSIVIRTRSNVLYVYGSAEGTSIDDLFTHSKSSMVSDTWYWVKVTFDGTKYVSSLSTDGVEYTEFGTTETTTSVYPGAHLDLGAYSTSYHMAGYIDLNECYINYNGNRVWNGTIEAPYTISETAAYTLSTATPTSAYLIKGATREGVLVKNNDYGYRHARPPVVGSSSFEVLARFDTATTTTDIGLFSDQSNLRLYVNSSAVLDLYVGGSHLLGQTVLSANSRYWVKLTYSSETGYELSLSTDGSTYNVEASSSELPAVSDTTSSQYMMMPQCYNYNPKDITFYMGESYIKVDGVEVWRGADIDDGTIALPVCWKHIDGVLYEYKNGVPPTRALKLQEGQSVTLPGTNNLYVTKTGDVCGLAIANSSPVGVDSSAVIGTVELSKDGVLTAYTQTA